MLRTYRIGSLFGFPLEVNLTFLILLGVFMIWLGPVAGLTFVILAFGSVLLHELGHALVARWLGVPVAGIELHFFGGTAKMIGAPRSSGDEIAIAAAGPAVSFALGGVGVALAALTHSSFFVMFAWINLVMALFNLVPALPMDGGRIFRALLSRRMGMLRATEVSVTVARGVAIVMGVVGLVTLQIYLALLAVVLWTMGTAELNNARAMAAYGQPRGGALDMNLPPGWRGRSGEQPRVHVIHWNWPKSR